jgi:hypothetical protein
MLNSMPPVSRLSRNCGILDVSQPYRPPRSVTGIALLLVIIIPRSTTPLRKSRKWSNTVSTLTEPEVPIPCSQQPAKYCFNRNRYSLKDPLPNKISGHRMKENECCFRINPISLRVDISFTVLQSGTISIPSFIQICQLVTQFYGSVK